MSDMVLLDTDFQQENNKKLFVFHSGEVLFGIPLSSVFEIQDDLELLNLPWKNNGILGAIQYRGLLIPVVHPSLMVNLNSSPKDNHVKSYLLCEHNHIKIAFQIDKFYKIINDESEDESEDEEVDHSDQENRFISGISILDKYSLILLNIKEITEYFKNKVKKQVISKQKSKSKSKTSEKISEEDSTKSICFTIDKIQFVVPIQEVLEVLENQSVTPLFRVTESLRGLINLRGRVVPCVDISSYLNLPPRNLNEYTQFILFGFDSMEVALCVDSVNKMKVFPNSKLQTNTDSLPPSIRDYTRGIVKSQKQTLLMLSSKN